MIIVDTTQNHAVNKSINLKNLANYADGKVDCLQVLATGALTSGEVKLTISQDNINFYPLTDENGLQITLQPQNPVYLKFANLFLKCDLTSAVVENFKVQVQ
ncbi:MAG: hypothetical protein LBM71_00750 [Elusimicrobiota bacterium]|jgi:hypothetical protein|nr:hypothetical protein [Elusimicrobiota bacterium]